MALYSEDHRDGDTEPVYPINAVRNRALQMVETQVGRFCHCAAEDIKIAHFHRWPGCHGMHPHLCIALATAGSACWGLHTLSE
jgi:hypothetical protein